MFMKIIFKRLSVLIVLAISLVAIIKLFSFSTETDQNPDNTYEMEFYKNYRLYNPPLPTEFDFAGENVPLNNFTVNERFEFEVLKIAYWHSNMFVLFKRANRFFPIIEPILKENNIPDDFKYLAVIESGLDNVVSPAGAAGYWQLMRATAQEKGLEVNDEIDERYNIEKSTQAACDYLNEAYKKFNNWTIVAASYNMGMGGINRVTTAQMSDDYYDLVLNSETQRYVYRILAAKYIFENPKAAGFYLREKDLYPPYVYSTIEIDSSINNLSVFAQTLGISYRVFKDLNPWLRKSYLRNYNKNTYQIKIPDPIMMNYYQMKADKNNKIGIFGDTIK